MMRKAILAAAFAALFIAPAQALDSSLSPEANAAFLAANAKKPGVVVESSGLQHRAIHTGFGKRPQATDIVTANYKGTLINGQVFDATEPGLPAQFAVNKLIPGWTEALEKMREGDEWELVIPANLAYGTRGAGNAIPPNQALVFDVTLISVSPPPPDEDKDKQPH
ncbi:MAG TPA: FKBP-type peptidyl-prolyl cis-trans isomerase [Rhizomicrobium sp.]|jgi:FKBP-type peptidyl-prolyl cis-trans isomerase|nr:FKBP-type peptidyl-prolyl cis-trans isomerase [Rhizomicrobium sp.]